MEIENQKDMNLATENKNTMEKVPLVQLTTYREIQNVIHLFNKIMIPCLSERVFDLDAYADKLYHNAYVYAATNNELKWIGFTAFYANDRRLWTAYLSQIAVLPAVQKKGIGKKLLDRCIEVAKRDGMLSLKLEVYQKNDTAIHFYVINGFQPCGYATQESIYMIKNLA